MNKQNKKQFSNTNTSDEIIIYEGTDGVPRIEVQIKDEIVWLASKKCVFRR